MADIPADGLPKIHPSLIILEDEAVTFIDALRAQRLDCFVEEKSPNTPVTVVWMNCKVV